MLPDAGSLGASNSLRSRFGIGEPVALTRVATAIVGIPVVVLITIVGGTLFKVAVILIAVVAAWEGYQLLRSRGHKPALLFVLSMSALLATAPGSSNPLLWWQATLVVGMFATGLWILASGAGKESFLDWTLTVLVALYAGGLISFLSGLRFLAHGLQLVLLLLIATWAYDTGAYMVGRTLGRTPFMSHISAHKTWEGVAGGLLLAIVSALVFSIPLSIDIGVGVVVAIAVSVAAQLGDLVESLMKRYADVKDSGSIIPGHGGLLDRIDSLLFSGAAAYYVLLLAGYH